VSLAGGILLIMYLCMDNDFLLEARGFGRVFSVQGNIIFLGVDRCDRGNRWFVHFSAGCL
jgi:hypothetical protein